MLGTIKPLSVSICEQVSPIGVLPVYREAWEFVALQHEEEYEDVKHAALLLRPTAFGPYVCPSSRTLC